MIDREKVLKMLHEQFLRLPDEIDSEYTPPYRQVIKDLEEELNALPDEPCPGCDDEEQENDK